nr:immunoglobulin heavy chain junction region [Macaca mulatta]
CARGAFFDLW